MEWWIDEMLEEWKTGMIECWNDGMVGRGNYRTLLAALDSSGVGSLLQYSILPSFHSSVLPTFHFSSFLLLAAGVDQRASFGDGFEDGFEECLVDFVVALEYDRSALLGGLVFDESGDTPFDGFRIGDGLAVEKYLFVFADGD